MSREKIEIVIRMASSMGDEEECGSMCEDGSVETEPKAPITIRKIVRRIKRVSNSVESDAVRGIRSDIQWTDLEGCGESGMDCIRRFRVYPLKSGTVVIEVETASGEFQRMMVHPNEILAISGRDSAGQNMVVLMWGLKQINKAYAFTSEVDALVFHEAIFAAVG